MNEEVFLMEDGVEVAAPVLLKVQRPDRYGKVQGLSDDELADPAEIERWVLRAELEPLFLLPKPKQKKWYSPAWDVHSDTDFNAFSSVDFDRLRPEFDNAAKARYKADKLIEEVQDRVIMFRIVSERIPGMNKYRVLKYVWMGGLLLDDIIDDDVRALAKLYVQIRKVKEQVVELREFSRQREERKIRKWLRS